MKRVIRIQQRDQDIDIQQGTHELPQSSDPLRIHQLPHFLQGHYFPPSRDERYSTPCHRLGSRSSTGFQAAPR